jgi:DNA-binding NarL/FixJ family response regulator
MQGRGQLLPAHRAALMERYRTMQTARQDAGAGLSKLTPRERVVLARLADGLSAASIAAESYTSNHTVRTHIRTIFTKLEVNTQAAAIALAVQHPSLPIPPKSTLSRRRHTIPEVQQQYAGSCEPDDKGRA